MEKTILDIKRLNRDRPPKEILALALTPPKLDDIEITILKLKEVNFEFLIQSVFGFCFNNFLNKGRSHFFV